MLDLLYLAYNIGYLDNLRRSIPSGKDKVQFIEISKKSKIPTLYLDYLYQVLIMYMS
jgi:hypothetical protein